MSSSPAKIKDPAPALRWKGKGRNKHLMGRAIVKVQAPIYPNWEQGGEWLICDENKIYVGDIPHDEMLSIVLDNFRDPKNHRFNGKLKTYWQASFADGRITFEHQVKDQSW